jgi:hypothetical protein
MSKSKVPRWLNVSWWIIFPLAAIIVGRLLYERTYLAWKLGHPILLGFSFAHTQPWLFILSMSGFLLAHVWLLVALVFVFLKPAQVSRMDWLKIGLVVLMLALMYLPIEKLLGLPEI